VRFHDLEAAGRALGRAVAQGATERLAFARAERLSGRQPCPTCGRLYPLIHRDRPLETIDGPLELHEPVCHCPACRRDVFPQRPALGLDQRSYSAAVVDKIVSANAEEKSAYKARKMLRKLAELSSDCARRSRSEMSRGDWHCVPGLLEFFGIRFEQDRP